MQMKRKNKDNSVLWRIIKKKYLSIIVGLYPVIIKINITNKNLGANKILLNAGMLFWSPSNIDVA